METSATISETKRRENLQNLLGRLRDETYEGIARYRQDQSEEKESSPGDEMDMARASAAVDAHASLIDRAEERLRLIDEALARVAQGTYGVCAECGDEIGLERLKALPFAARCVDCESKRGRTAAGSRVSADHRRWTPPPEASDSETVERPVRAADDDDPGLASEFDTEPEEMEEQPPAQRGRRRGRPRSS